MSFYSDLSKYYDLIFPLNLNETNFLASIVGNGQKEVLDIACGTGEHSIELAKQGYLVTAVDIDTDMIKNLSTKSEKLKLEITTINTSMLEIDTKINSEFDLAFCIGNSLVHLDDIEEICAFLNSLKHLIKSSGKLVLQIINFDRILTKNIKELPLIEVKQENLVFKRYYQEDLNSDKIKFKTILSVNNKEYINEVNLYPLLSEQLVLCLNKCGFESLALYSNFLGESFDRTTSYSLVIVATLVK